MDEGHAGPGDGAAIDLELGEDDIDVGGDLDVDDDAGLALVVADDAPGSAVRLALFDQVGAGPADDVFGALQGAVDEHGQRTHGFGGAAEHGLDLPVFDVAIALGLRVAADPDAGVAGDAGEAVADAPGEHGGQAGLLAVGADAAIELGTDVEVHGHVLGLDAGGRHAAEKILERDGVAGVVVEGALSELGGLDALLGGFEEIVEEPAGGAVFLALGVEV